MCIESYLPRTPLLHNLPLSRELGFEAYLKLENLQPIGAFKVRGGVYLASTLSEEERARGIIGASTGNHGQSLAYGANLFGIRCVIAMPGEANPMKVESMRALGAEVEFQGANFEEARLWAEETARREGMRYVHHINSPAARCRCLHDLARDRRGPAGRGRHHHADRRRQRGRRTLSRREGATARKSR